LIVVGDVGSARLAKTNLAKSVNDAGWALFKTLLSYKAIARKVVYREVSERLSTQICSGCGAISGPNQKVEKVLGSENGCAVNAARFMTATSTLH